MYNFSKQQIFIVDDDIFWTSILSKMLEEIGDFKIHTYTNVEACMIDIHLGPHYVFLDYQMDKINGLEALELLQIANPEIQVIFCTAHEDLQVAMAAIQGGSKEYLLKGNATKKEVKQILDTVLF